MRGHGPPQQYIFKWNLECLLVYDSLQDKEIWTHQPSAGNNKVPANLKSRGGGVVEGGGTQKQRTQTHPFRFVVAEMSQG